MLTDDDGQVRKDWRMGDVADIKDETLYEQVIAPGEQVCVIGTWSAEKRGLVPHEGVQARLIRGDAAQVARTLRGKLITNLIIAVIFGCAINGILYGLVTLKRHGSSPPGTTTPASRTGCQQRLRAVRVTRGVNA